MKKKVLIAVLTVSCCIFGFSQESDKSQSENQKKGFSVENIMNKISDKRAENAAKRAKRKSPFDEYPQIVYNDAPFPVKIKLMDERTFLYKEVTLPPQEVSIINTVLYKEGSSSANRLLVSGNNVYIKSEQKMNEKSSVYIIKPLRNRRFYNEDLYDEDLPQVNKTETPAPQTNAAEAPVPATENTSETQNPALEPEKSENLQEIPAVTETSETPAVTETLQSEAAEQETTLETEEIPAEESPEESTENAQSQETQLLEEEISNVTEKTTSEIEIPAETQESAAEEESTPEEAPETEEIPEITSDSDDSDDNIFDEIF